MPLAANWPGLLIQLASLPIQHIPRGYVENVLERTVVGERSPEGPKPPTAATSAGSEVARSSAGPCSTGQSWCGPPLWPEVAGRSTDLGGSQDCLTISYK